MALTLDDPQGDVSAVLDGAAHTRPGDLIEMLSVIREYFGQVDDFPSLMKHLRGEDQGFGAHCLDQLRKSSPTSLKLTLKQMSEAPETFADCIAREFHVAANLMAGHDFYEGVRAQVIDKDRNPQWNPARLDEVTDDAVAAYFEEPAGGPLDLSGISD